MKSCIRETFDFLLLLIYSFLYYVLSILLAIRFYTIVQNRFFLFFSNMIKPVEMILFSLWPIEYSFLRTCNFMWCHHDRVIHVDPVCLYISVFIIFVMRSVFFFNRNRSIWCIDDVRYTAMLDKSNKIRELFVYFIDSSFNYVWKTIHQFSQS